jgi:hypothetical protein
MQVSDEQLSQLRLTRNEWDELHQNEQAALLTEEDSSAHVDLDDDDLEALGEVADEDKPDEKPEEKPEAKPDEKPDEKPAVKSEPEEEPEPFVAMPALPTQEQLTAQQAEFDRRKTELTTRETALEEQITQLDKRYEDGDLTSVEHARESRTLQKQINDLVLARSRIEAEEIAARQSVADRQASANTIMAQRFEFAKEAFFEQDDAKSLYEHAELGAKAKAILLEQFIPALAQDPSNSKRSFTWFLKEADRRVRAFMVDEIAGLPKPAKAADKTPPGRKPDLSKIPPNLNVIPAADAETPAGEFANLETLTGPKLLAAIEAMTPAQRERWENQQ